jgi:hypothetical protein
MEYRSPRIVAILIAGIISLSATSLAADTYRWKDKDGNTHYGAVVPAEYADQPYDVIRNGLVVEHIEDTSIPLEVIAAKKIEQKRAPLISAEQRQVQSDRLLVIRYSSAEEIQNAQELEVAQLGHDIKLIKQSYDSTNVAIKSQISLAADHQRAGQQISTEQQKEIDKLYNRLIKEENRRAVMNKREVRIRARYQSELERYRYLTGDDEESDQASTDQMPADQG